MKSILTFRDLRADEVELRAAQVGDGWAQLLLYKDARCDQNILDESVGPMNWQRSHTRDNANCVVSLWDETKQQWVSKEDTGTESNTEKEKGLASDSFKRACFNWGIGRELYSAPTIFINVPTERDGSRFKLPKKFRMRVSEMEVHARRIVKLVIVDGNGKVLFNWTADNYGKTTTSISTPTPTPTPTTTPIAKPVVAATNEPIFLEEDEDYQAPPARDISDADVVSSLYYQPTKSYAPPADTNNAQSQPSVSQPETSAPKTSAAAGKSKFVRRV